MRARLFVFAAVAEGDCYDILFVSRCRNPRLYFSLKEPLSAIGANLALRKDLILITAVRRPDQGAGTCRYTVNEKRSTNMRRHGPSMPWTGASDQTSALGWRSAASLRNTTTRWTKRRSALYISKLLCSVFLWLLTSYHREVYLNMMYGRSWTGFSNPSNKMFDMDDFHRAQTYSLNISHKCFAWLL